MSNDLPVFFNDLEFLTYKNIVLLLDVNENWRKVGNEFGFSELDITEISLSNKPSEVLLSKLEIRACPVSIFCDVLQSCNLLNILCLLKEPEPLEIIEQPTGNGSDNVLMVDSGGVLELTCKAVGLPPPSYQWFCNETRIVNGVDSTLKITPFLYENEGDYYCCVTQDGSDLLELVSDIVFVSVIPEPPVIISQSLGSETCRAGSTIQFHVVAQGYPQLSYQWYRENTQLDGACDNTLTLRNVDADVEGTYRCYINNTAGEVWTEGVLLSVYVAPEDIQDLDSRCVANGKLALLIANQNYENLNPLNTSANDVMTLSYILKDLGYHTLALENLSLVEMRNAVSWFSEIIPAGAYVLFYFAGHGFQIRDKFMLPVDAPKPEEFLQTDAFSERELLKSLLGANPKVLVELLDMCLKAPDFNNKKLFEESSDLHEYVANNNLIQGYATTSYLGAYEKKTDWNGLYVKHMKEYMRLDIPIVKILDKVAKAIEADKPKEVQIPYRGTNVTTEFRLTDPQIKVTELDRMFEEISILPDYKTVKFENTDILANVTFSPYADIFLNTLRIVIGNVSGYKLKCQVDTEDLIICVLSIGENWIVTIKDIQKFKSEKSLSLYLFSESNNDMIGHAVLDIKKPMIGILDLWCKSDKI